VKFYIAEFYENLLSHFNFVCSR